MGTPTPEGARVRVGASIAAPRQLYDKESTEFVIYQTHLAPVSTCGGLRLFSWLVTRCSYDNLRISVQI